jgi:hypothetical protein
MTKRISFGILVIGICLAFGASHLVLFILFLLSIVHFDHPVGDIKGLGDMEHNILISF